MSEHLIQEKILSLLYDDLLEQAIRKQRLEKSNHLAFGSIDTSRETIDRGEDLHLPIEDFLVNLLEWIDDEGSIG